MSYWDFENGNKYSKNKYTYEVAKELNETLHNCENCIDCKVCWDCKDLKNCDNCKNCNNSLKCREGSV